MMTFAKALEAETKEERNNLIHDEISNHDWDDLLSEHADGNGVNSSVWDTEVDDSRRSELVVDVDFRLKEIQTTGCKDLSFRHKGMAKARIVIDRRNGKYEVEVTDYDCDHFGGSNPYGDPRMSADDYG